MFTFSVTIHVSVTRVPPGPAASGGAAAAADVKQRELTYLLPVLLQAACRGEVAGVMHQLQLLENAAVGQYIHDGEEPV